MEEEGAEGEGGGGWLARDGTGGEPNVADVCLNWCLGSGDSFLGSETKEVSDNERVDKVAV